MTTQDAVTDAAIEQLAAEILFYELIATFLYQYYSDEVEKQQVGELYFFRTASMQDVGMPPVRKHPLHGYDHPAKQV
jgi:hypothetical protein